MFELENIGLQMKMPTFFITDVQCLLLDKNSE